MNIDEFGNIHERFAFTGCRGRHPLHSYIYCKNAIPNMRIIRRMNIAEFGNIHERYAFTGCWGRRPLQILGLCEGAIPKKSYKRCRQIIGYTNQKN